MYEVIQLPEKSTYFGKQYGKFSQLSVIGWNGVSGKGIKYFIKCSICSEDPELFGAGVFKSSASNLSRSYTPCGCGANPNWSKDQYSIRCSRKATKLGYVFKGFVGEWKGKNTKIHLNCAIHGDWFTGIIGTLLHSEEGCPRCAAEARRVTRLKPDLEMIQSFFASNAFHPDTKFWRSERKDSEGKRKFWFVACPVCSETSETLSSSLRSGHLPCLCSPNRQKQAYINLISDGTTPVAIKFGIANSTENRLKRQNYSSIYNIVNFCTYIFPTKQSCQSAERECKRVLECSIIPISEMLDGYTETTHIYNIDKIINIYKRYGGIENVIGN